MEGGHHFACNWSGVDPTERAGSTCAQILPRMATVRPEPRDPERPRLKGGAAVAYAVGWLVAVAAAVGLVLALAGHDNDVSLPPVHARNLVAAARDSRCELRGATAGERLNPPVDGPAGARPAAPGVYAKSPPVAALTAALRRGLIVVQFRDDLPDEALGALEALQAAVPKGTIVTPDATGMPFALAVTAYGHLLGCPRYDDRVLDAVRLFRGRFLGSGPPTR